MKRYGIVATFLVALASTFGCQTTGEEIDRVQTNLVDKSVFEGEWWYAQTVVDVDGDEAGIAGTFNGMMGWADLGVDEGGSGSVARIRWVIDEDFLFAYRAYELIDGGNDDGREAEFRGQPLAVFGIESHVDVRYDYNGLTGERTNVRVEDTSDRRWYERQFIRVDWSQNLVTSFYYLTGADLFGNITRESAPFFFQTGAHEDFPASYMPQFVRISEDADYRFADEWPADMQDEVHYMSFVNQELYSPGANCLFYNIPCQTAAVTIRSSFLRVPPNHEFAVEQQSHREFDRFGTFRTYQRTYVRGGNDESELEARCSADSDCGIGGYCDMSFFPAERGLTGVGVCSGGLTNDYGETDFLTFYRPRHNHFVDHLTDTACVADYQCDGRFGAGDVGSVCDRSARRCTVPVAAREVREVGYWLNPGFPKHLVQTAFETVGDWNGSFMAGHRGRTGRPLPSAASVSCQSTNPIGYCFCGSPDDRGDGTCSYKYDPFMSPADAMAAGVVEPYDCHIQAPDGYVDPANPTSYDEYSDAVYGYEFVGEECAFVLHANSCDKDPAAACEDLGDLRYQFFNYIQHGNLRFGGVSMPLVDPTTGEFISSNANMAAPSVESAVTTAIDFFPVLRDEPGAVERYFEGEVTRDYFQNIGKVERPVSYAPSGTDGYSVTDSSRPGMPVPNLERLRGAFEERLADFQRLAPGPEGRANILSDRMRNLAGTEIESRLIESMGPDGAELTFGQTDVTRIPDRTSALAPDLIDQTSPFRDGFMGGMMQEREHWHHLGRLGMDPPMAPEISNTIYKYWADIFADRPQEEAAIRMSQLFLRGVMHHEVGHSVGLRHNFGGSYDRHQFNDGYYNVVLRDDLALPSLFDDEYDPDGDGFQGGEDVARFYDDLRRVRDARHEAGLGMTMTNSVMDYDGDMSGFGGLGHYDKAAANWNAFGLVEAFTADPVMSRGDSLDDVTDPRTPRTMMFDYRGGEACVADSDCPHSQGRVDQPVFQRCILNVRDSRLPTPCDGGGNCQCSPFYEDVIDYSIGVAPYDTATEEMYPVDYLFCTDDRVQDISWCNRFDAGESFTETIDFFRRRFEESYPTSYYRRFRDTSLGGLSTLGFVIDAAKIYQHLFFRYFNEPGFSSEEGALGFNDQFFASIDAMNWMTEIVTMPDAGSYEYDPDGDVYRYLGEEMDMDGSDMNVPVGVGFPTWSKYQDGYFGFYRRERAGVFMDKFYAMLALAIRDWGFSFTIDERYFINFYDLFPVEMTEFFGGLIIDEDRWFQPRVEMVDGTPQIEYLNWYRGTCNTPTGRAPCRPDQETVYPGTAIADTTPEILRDWATVLALAQFAVFYDTSFEQRLSIFKVGSGESFGVPELQSDGSRTCAYRDAVLPGATHDSGCNAEDADYVIYESDRFHTGYVAVKVKPRLTYNLEEEQLGYQLMRRLVDKQQRLRALRRIDDPTRAERDELIQVERDVNSNESFLEYLIDVQRQYGISAYFL